LKELPDFVKFANQHKNIRLLFVSLDFKKDYRETLPALITKYHITSPVYFLNESKAGNWIGDVDPSWSGAIPATLFYRKNKHLFIQDTFTTQSLTDTLTTFIK
jgi:hypothetical protein